MIPPHRLYIGARCRFPFTGFRRHEDKCLLLALFVFLYATAGTVIAGFRPVVLSVGSDTLMVQTSAKVHPKITDIDADENKTQEPLSNIVTFHVPATARIEVNGLPSKLSDVKSGMTVDIAQGLDRTTAYSIVARTVPPPAPPLKGKGRAMFQGVNANIVLAVTSERITYGAPGAAQAYAAFITPWTRIYVGKHRDDISGVWVGSHVDVAMSDGTHADTIRVSDPGQ